MKLPRFHPLVVLNVGDEVFLWHVCDGSNPHMHSPAVPYTEHPQGYATREEAKAICDELNGSER